MRLSFESSSFEDETHVRTSLNGSSEHWTSSDRKDVNGRMLFGTDWYGQRIVRIIIVGNSH